MLYEFHAAWDEDPAHDDMIVCDCLDAARELAKDARAAGAIVVFIAERGEG